MSSSDFSDDEERALLRFRQFLQIRTVSSEGPSGSYREAITFLKAAFVEYGFKEEDLVVVEYVEKKPVLIVTFKGRDPSLPSVLLNSHYDVVPADDSMWNTEPFSAEVADGKIYARGTQDMKCVCIQYVEAIGRLHKKVLAGELDRPLRTIHLSFLPDEEIGGAEGAAYFVKSKEYESLNIGVALDEGLANPLDQYTVFYGERAPWWLKVTAEGPTGHASRFIKRTAIEKLSNVIAKAYEFRTAQQKKLHPTADCEGGCSHSMAKKLGDVVTLNVTALRAGVPGGEAFDGWALNCIPTEAFAGIDIRISPSFPMEDMTAILDEWTKEEGLSYTFFAKTPKHSTTAIDSSNKWWGCFEASMKKQGKAIATEIFPAATDSRYFRQVGLPCFGFSPISNTPVLLHDHNEYLSESVFLSGVGVYEVLIMDLASLSD